MDDPVNNPSHYGQGKIEAIDYIEDFLTDEEYQGYLRGNIAKYLHRWPYKGKPIEDLKKAQWYLSKLIEHMEGATHEVQLDLDIDFDFLERDNDHISQPQWKMARW